MKQNKIKPLTKDKLIISIDRLTRFKRGKYFRVFSEIVTKNLITPKYTKFEIEQMEPDILKTLAQEIINYSLESLGYKCDGDFEINKLILDYEKSVYYLDDYNLSLIDNNIDYKSIVKLIDDNSAKNLLWLKALAENENITKTRKEKGFCFPIEKIVIVEGATEEILLPEFAKFCDYDFDKNGIYVIPAGGKNQVVKLYYELLEVLRLPIFILLDKDAQENLEEIKIKLRKKDKVHILNCGEFEDLLPNNLINKAIESEFSNISIIEKNTFLNTTEPHTKILEDFFKTHGLHDFKKAEFARIIKKYLKDNSYATPEIRMIIEELKNI